MVSSSCYIWRKRGTEILRHMTKYTQFIRSRAGTSNPTVQPEHVLGTTTCLLPFGWEIYPSCHSRVGMWYPAATRELCQPSLQTTHEKQTTWCPSGSRVTHEVQVSHFLLCDLERRSLFFLGLRWPFWALASSSVKWDHSQLPSGIVMRIRWDPTQWELYMHLSPNKWVRLIGSLCSFCFYYF